MFSFPSSCRAVAVPYTALVTASLAFFAASLKLSVAVGFCDGIGRDGGDTDASCLAFATTLSIHCDTLLFVVVFA